MRFKTNPLLLLVYKLAFWVVIRFSIYYTWSRVYRSLFERKYRKIPLTSFKNIADLTAFMRPLVWQEDGARRLWDAVTMPERIEYVIRECGGKATDGGTDCDDSSIYICWAVDNMMKSGYVKSFTDGPWMMSIVYADGNRLQGHNVCVWSYEQIGTKEPRLAHMSNWNNHRPINDFKTLDEIAAYVAKDKTLIGYARCNKHLKLIDYKVGE